MEILTIKNLTFSYGDEEEKAIENISFSLEEGAFLCLGGKSGSGKSTLLRMLKPQLTLEGKKTGEIFLRNVPLASLSPEQQSQAVGLVSQNPHDQIVTDMVWHELAFGLENLGCDQNTMNLRVAEMASFFGIEHWFYRKTHQLSGGEKQLLNLASVMVMQPEILVLDEPTAQLDPLASEGFLASVKKINQELGTTVIMASHSLKDVFFMADRALYLEKGKGVAWGSPQKVGEEILGREKEMMDALPTAMQGYFLLEGPSMPSASIPLTIGQGKQWLKDRYPERPPLSFKESFKEKENPPVMVLKDLWFRYGKKDPDVLRGFTLQIHEGEIFAIVGGNGTGKTTALKAMAQIYPPYRGSVKTLKRVGYVPQDPQTMFLGETVEAVLTEGLAWQKERAEEILALMELNSLRKRHPYDLSGGEQQRLAMGRVLMADPEILLLDEPTKGMDWAFKKVLGNLFFQLKQQGKTIVLVSHDMDFCARYAHRCALLFQGSIATVAPTRAFFSGNHFYTTEMNKMAKPLISNALIPEDLLLLKENSPPNPPKKDLSSREDGISSMEREKKPVIQKKKIGKKNIPENISPKPSFKRKDGILWLGLLVLVGGSLFFSLRFAEDKTYYLLSFFIVVYGIFGFFLTMERRKPTARTLVFLAVLIAMGVVGRMAFFMIPQVKPVLGIAIIAGVALGPYGGFFVGSMIAFTSNFLFGQGPWTPWQVVALGLVGMLAGLFFAYDFHQDGVKTREKKRYALILLFGFFSAFLYGAIVDLWTIFVLTSTPSIASAVVVYGAALPFNLVLAVSTVAFLLLLYHPLMKKMVRMEKKYGVIPHY